MTDSLPCTGRWDVYDILVDHTNGPAYFRARLEARSICGSCPILTQCLRANRAEPWVKAITASREKQMRREAKAIREWAALHDVPCPPAGAPPEQVRAGWQADDPDLARRKPAPLRGRVIRQWAKENGLDCPATGRVPKYLALAYDTAQHNKEKAA